MHAAMRPHGGRRLACRLAPLLVLTGVIGCGGHLPPQVTPLPKAWFTGTEVIGDLKEFAESLGGDRTENFRSSSTRLISDERCYFTGKLQLPEYVSHLRLVREDQARCTSRADQFDVFFYPVQAVASGDETITVSLSEAPVERMLVVVPHEDFHNQAEARKAPAEAAESAATLVGFLTARAFAMKRFGADSVAFRLLANDVETFLRKSSIVNRYYTSK